MDVNGVYKPTYNWGAPHCNYLAVLYIMHGSINPFNPWHQLGDDPSWYVRDGFSNGWSHLKSPKTGFARNLGDPSSLNWFPPFLPVSFVLVPQRKLLLDRMFLLHWWHFSWAPQSPLLGVARSASGELLAGSCIQGQLWFVGAGDCISAWDFASENVVTVYGIFTFKHGNFMGFVAQPSWFVIVALRSKGFLDVSGRYIMIIYIYRRSQLGETKPTNISLDIMLSGHGLQYGQQKPQICPNYNDVTRRHPRNRPKPLN